MAKLPMAHARCKGVRRSRGLTVAFMCSAVEWASNHTIDFMSILCKIKIN